MQRRHLSRKKGCSISRILEVINLAQNCVTQHTSMNESRLMYGGGQVIFGSYQLTPCQPGGQIIPNTLFPPPPKLSDIPTALSMNESRVMVVGK